MENLVILLAGLWAMCAGLCILAGLGLIFGLIDPSELR